MECNRAKKSEISTNRLVSNDDSLKIYKAALYLVVFNYFRGNQGASPGFAIKTVLGIAAGAIGAFVGTPAEVALIRMTADGRLPKEQRRNYKNVVDALAR